RRESANRCRRDDLLWTRLDEAHLVEAQGVEPDGIFRIVFTPFVVGVFTEGLQAKIVARCELALDKAPRSLLGVGGAEVRRFEDRPHYPLGRNRMVAHILPIAAQHAATYCGAPQISGVWTRRTTVVSSAPSAASARGLSARPPAPAA